MEEEGTTIEIKISINPWSVEGTEILQAYIHEFGPIGISEHPDGISAFFHTNQFRKDIFSAIQMKWNQDLGILTWEQINHPFKNWNKYWEHHFEPVVVENRCRVRAPFHHPDATLDYDLIVQPKMAFGTGHHETTYMMVSTMLEHEMQQDIVLDMGCGTGILSILASKMGAEQITAVDIDEQAIQNAHENIQLNGCSNIQLIRGNAGSVPIRPYDLILANIHLNMVFDDLPLYAGMLAQGGRILTSGYRASDERIVIERAWSCHLKKISRHIRGEWLLICFTTK